MKSKRVQAVGYGGAAAYTALARPALGDLVGGLLRLLHRRRHLSAPPA